MKNVTRTLLLGLALVTSNATAALINGTLTIGGEYDAIGGDSDLALTTEVDIINMTPNNATGDILANISYTSGTGGTAVLQPFSGGDNFVVLDGWEVDITSLFVDKKTSNALDLSGTGTLWKSGFDITPVNWEFSAESSSNYSMSIATVPVPAALWLFGSGLLGLVGIARRKAC